MKKLIYGITVICLMFIGIVSVNAMGGVDVSVTDIKIEEGSTGTFNIIVDNALARANIKSNDNNVATVKEAGSWVSASDGKGVIKEHPITINAVGKAGDKTTVLVEVFDASSYDGDYLATESSKLNYVINVSIVEKGSLTGYKVMYDANGGSNAPVEQKKETDKELTLSNVKPTNNGYEFIGWNTKADGSGISYLAGGKYTENANVTLYAQWKLVDNVDKNPNTGDSAILIIIAIAVTFGGYTYWYTKKSKEN